MKNRIFCVSRKNFRDLNIKQLKLHLTIHSIKNFTLSLRKNHCQFYIISMKILAWTTILVKKYKLLVCIQFFTKNVIPAQNERTNENRKTFPHQFQQQLTMNEVQ